MLSDNCHCLVRYKQRKKAVGSFETSGTNKIATDYNDQKDVNHQHQNGGKYIHIYITLQMLTVWTICIAVRMLLDVETSMS